jgi:hypothetical protein
MRRGLIGIALLATLAGCGGSAAPKTGEHAPHESLAAQEVRASVQGWLRSLQTPKSPGSSPRACGYLTPHLQKSIDEQLRVRGEHANCKTFAARWTGGSNPPGRVGAHITAIKVGGEQATVTLKAPPDRESDVTLRKLRGRWLIENY